MEVAATPTDGGIQPVRLDHPQAGLHLRRPRPGPTVFNRNFGMAWGIGGWLLTPFLQSIGPATFQTLRQRVAAELTTTFASTYTKEVSLAEALQPEAFAVYAKQRPARSTSSPPTSRRDPRRMEANPTLPPIRGATRNWR